MARYEHSSPNFRITHTIEESGSHITIPYDFYEENFTITILISGSGTCYIEGNNYSLSDGDIVILSPDDIHSFKFTQDGYHERMTIYLSGSLLSGFSEHQLSFIRIFRGFNKKKKYIYSKICYDESATRQIYNELCEIIKDDIIEMKEARIHLLLLRLLFVLYDSEKSESDTSKRDLQSSVIAEICSYIKEHLDEPISYKEIENNFFISHYQLTKQFLYYTGMSFTEYITIKRLMNAVSLVRNGDGIESAAYMSGFNTYSHFYKEFVKYFNCSPKKYFNKKGE